MLFWITYDAFLRLSLHAITPMKPFRLLVLGTLVLPPLALAMSPVLLREVDEVIPTYLSGPPDPNPMFHFGRMSQGAEGRIYPYPLYDNLTNRRGEQTYRLVYLENEYVRIGILPEIGGRLFSAHDRTNGYDYIYRQHVIKPALIGLIGAWISGGIEWNIPHHHRATTFLPVQWHTEDHADGSKTVWVGELELRHRMRWAVGYTLRPGSSVLECSVRIANRTPFVNTMLCFANVAVHANENYQIIFPPSTQWVTHHHKREFTQWPNARQPYGGVDWQGEDVSWYKNHRNANSMFAWNYTDDFFAGYDHGRQAGTMSVADHRVVPGKKFWTWGSGSRGRMWDEILTDTDGPYIELMVGAYSDNQPDYSWLQPFATRTFVINWYPFRDIGGVKNANLNAAVNLEVRDGIASVGFNTTRAYAGATVRLAAEGRVLDEERITISPAQPYTKTVNLPPGTDPHAVRASLVVEGREIIGYSPLRLEPMPQPAAVEDFPAPAAFGNEEELFLAGQRLDQFHNPDHDADPYWEELLRRDPGDTAANTGLGLLALRRAKFSEAEAYFLKALDRLTANYTVPKNVEPFYYLGVALEAQGKTDEAIDAYSKAAWSQEWKSPACYGLAQIAAARGDFAAALDFVNQSLDANALNVRAYGLKSAVLRHLGQVDEVRPLLDLAARKTDPLDVRWLAEQWLAQSSMSVPPMTSQGRPAPVHGQDAQAAADVLFTALHAHPATAQELAIEYANAGLWRDAEALLDEFLAATPDRTLVSPLVYYLLGDLAEKLGEHAKAASRRREAALASPDYVFPFQWEMIGVLRRAIAANAHDARAPYYLGNLLFDWQPAEAIALWEKSVALDPNFAIAWRNLAQAPAHRTASGSVDEQQVKAIALLEKAVALPHSYPTHLAELDQLYEAAGAPVEKRLTLLERHERTAMQRDDSFASLIQLKTFTGQADRAIEWLRERTFNVWEGGTRYSTAEMWAHAHLVRGLQRLITNRARDALADFEAALAFPANLRAFEQMGAASRQAEFAYWIGRAHEALGEREKAHASWTVAAHAAADEGSHRPDRRRGALAGAVGRYYQALALRQLGQDEQTAMILREILTAANAALSASTDSSALTSASPRRMTPRARTAMAHFIAGLGHAGLGERHHALDAFNAALTLSPDHLGAKLALERL
jgi:tetratricopeptide (TPR) repeat protein